MSTDDNFEDVSRSEWEDVFRQIKDQYHLLNNYERDVLETANPNALTMDQQKLLTDIYYERVVEKIPGRDRQEEP